MHHATGLSTGRKRSDTHLPRAPVYSAQAAEPTGSGNPEKKQGQHILIHFPFVHWLLWGSCAQWQSRGRGAFYNTVLLYSGWYYHFNLYKLMLLFKWVFLNMKLPWFLNHILSGRESVSAQTALDNISAPWHSSIPAALSPHKQHTVTSTHWGQNFLFPCVLPLCHCRHLKAELPTRTIK